MVWKKVMEGVGRAEKLWELFPGEDGRGMESGGRKGCVDSADNRAGTDARQDGRGFFKGCEPVGGHGGAAFDFDEREAVRRFFDQVDFPFFGVAVVEKVVGAPRMGEAFQAFGHDESLEEGAAEGVGFQDGGGFDAQQAAGEAGIEEVELGRFGELLSDVAGPGAEAADDVGGFEDGKPAFGRVDGNAGIGGQVGKVEDLRGASGAEAEEGCKPNVIADAEERADIAFEVGGNVEG